MSTVQAPQSPSLQTIFVPVRLHARRRKSDNDEKASRPRTSWRRPFTQRSTCSSMRCTPSGENGPWVDEVIRAEKPVPAVISHYLRREAYGQEMLSRDRGASVCHQVQKLHSVPVGEGRTHVFNDSSTF